MIQLCLGRELYKVPGDVPQIGGTTGSILYNKEIHSTKHTPRTNLLYYDETSIPLLYHPPRYNFGGLNFSQNNPVFESDNPLELGPLLTRTSVGSDPYGSNNIEYYNSNRQLSRINFNVPLLSFGEK